jgi:predicted phage baseplate assembly protein
MRQPLVRGVSDIRCAGDDRRELLRASGPEGVNGIDYVEIDPRDPRRLVVVFVRKLGPVAELEPGQVRVEVADGRRGRAVRVDSVDLCVKDDPKRDDCVTVTLDCPPDAGVFRVCIDTADPVEQLKGHAVVRRLRLDPLLACIEFRGDAGGRVDRDCVDEVTCEPVTRPMPAIDYLARDYPSIRRSILDRLALTVPDWDERHIPDIGMTIVEAMAYVADRFAYAQDAIGTEAYLPTARRRVSVRRHVRLVDHRLHEGTNARAWVVADTDHAVSIAADDVFFITTPATRPELGTVLRADALDDVPVESFEVFEPVVAAPSAMLAFEPSLSRIRIHAWGATECCLPAGSTSATLVLDRAGRDGLHAGSILVFEEVAGPASGAPADADPAHRHAVRLVARPRRVHDALAPDLELLEVRWGRDDALPFDLCLSTTTDAPDCRTIGDVSVARGNVVLVDHGRRVPPEIIARVPSAPAADDCATGACPPEDAGDTVPVRPTLERRPVVFAEPPSRSGSAAAAMLQDPARALPAITLGGFRYVASTRAGEGVDVARQELAEALDALVSLVRRLAEAPVEGDALIVTDEDRHAWMPPDRKPGEPLPVLERHLPLTLQAAPPPGVPATGRDRAFERALRRLVRSWEARADLLASGPDDAGVVVEVDEEQRAMLRFGDGELGAAPASGEVLFARYRIGGGPAGNVGAGRIRHLVLRSGTLDGVRLTVMNPSAAVGGRSPETIDHARRHAPAAPGRVLERAVTAEDYAALARRDFDLDLQGATAALEWTGSWFEASVALDERGVARASKGLCGAVERRLERYRRMGHDLAVVPADGVPVTVRLTVCVAPHALRGHVGARLAEVFGDGVLPDGSLGLFHPDALEAGMPLRLSQLVATALRVDGVISATVTALQRAGHAPAHELDAGILEVGPRQIVRLDPGGLTIDLEGGR